MERVTDERSVGALFAELATETTTLVRKEIALARAEIAQGMTRMTMGAVLLVAGGLVLFVALQALIACAILVLARWLDPWLSALIVGAALLAIGVVLMLVGKGRLSAASLTPRRTIATLRQDGAWAREQLNERL